MEVEHRRDIGLFRYSLVRIRPNSAEPSLCRAQNYADPAAAELRLTCWRAGSSLDDSA